MTAMTSQLSHFLHQSLTFEARIQIVSPLKYFIRGVL
jgi:hypothetical protein